MAWRWPESSEKRSSLAEKRSEAMAGEVADESSNDVKTSGNIAYRRGCGGEGKRWRHENGEASRKP